jgi:hypothetical protein
MVPAHGLAERNSNIRPAASADHAAIAVTCATTRNLCTCARSFRLKREYLKARLIVQSVLQFALFLSG